MQHGPVPNNLDARFKRNRSPRAQAESVHSNTSYTLAPKLSVLTSHQRAILVLAATTFLLVGCKNPELETHCTANGPATGSQIRVANPKSPTSCNAILMSCNYCEYDGEGRFLTAGSETCGVCLLSEF